MDGDRLGWEEPTAWSREQALDNVAKLKSVISRQCEQGFQTLGKHQLLAETDQSEQLVLLPNAHSALIASKLAKLVSGAMSSGVGSDKRLADTK